MLPFKRGLRINAVADILYEDVFLVLSDKFTNDLRLKLVRPGNSESLSQQFILECYSLISFENFNLKRNISSHARKPLRASDSSNISSADYLTTSQLCQAAMAQLGENQYPLEKTVATIRSCSH